jgi:hypothetical protein
MHYKQGMILQDLDTDREGAYYIIASLGGGWIIAVSLTTGNKYNEPFRVQDIDRISKKAIDTIFPTQHKIVLERLILG